MLEVILEKDNLNVDGCARMIHDLILNSFNTKVPPFIRRSFKDDKEKDKSGRMRTKEQKQTDHYRSYIYQLGGVAKRCKIKIKFADNAVSV